MRTALVAVGSLCAFAACALQDAAADVIRVAVATNFTATMNDLVARFREQSNHDVLLSFGSTGSHYAQIKNGAPFDVLFSADAERPRLLEEEGVAIAGSRFTYAVGRLVLWSRREGFVDANGRILENGTFRFLSIANPELAPYGAAAREVMMARGVWTALQGRLVQGQDIGQAYSFVYTGNAELGFVAYAQVKTPGAPIEGSFWLVPELLHAPIEQQAVLLQDVPAARAFIEFTKSPAAHEIIRSYGYGP
jgi:molybdate transport system substrate-binding protein